MTTDPFKAMCTCGMTDWCVPGNCGKDGTREYSPRVDHDPRHGESLENMVKRLTDKFSSKK